MPTQPWSGERLFGFQPTDHLPVGAKGDESYWIFGDLFLQLYYTTFDWPQKRIGLIEATISAGTLNITKAFHYLLLALLCLLLASGCFCRNF